MRIDLAGQRAWLLGERQGLRDAVAAALERNGCAVDVAPEAPVDAAPDILVLSRELLAAGGPAGTAIPDHLAEAMVRRGSGRIVVLLSALAALPARRFPEASLSASAGLFDVRLAAMRFGPAVLVNAIGCGVISTPEGPLVAGDAAMLSHVPTGQPGAVEDIVNAVLFLCDPANSYMTGQMLTVDGGWSAGYGRNF